jgi:hypothetical protein
MAWLTPKETTAREEQAHSGEQKQSQDVESDGFRSHGLRGSWETFE